MTITTRTLVLFDIDGTLVLTGRAGVRGMNAAFAELYGHPDALSIVDVAGRTDRAIVGTVFETLSVPMGDTELAGLRDAYIAALRREIDVPVEHPKEVLPGVLTLLEALEARDDVDVGLLTGNFEGGAAVKLGHFDLWRRFQFGAFGDRHVSRRDLVPLALERAAAAGVAPTRADQVVVIGDTPLDVDCAQAHGARSLAVATGPFERAALEAAGADLTVETLDGAADLITWMTRTG